MLLKLRLMRPLFVYIALGVLQLVGRLEGSSRSALTKACVPATLLPNALAFNTLTTYVGEFSAPALFYLTVSLGGEGQIGLSVALVVASISYVVASLTPSLIHASGSPKAGKAEPRADSSTPPTCVASMGARVKAMVAGLTPSP